MKYALIASALLASTTLAVPFQPRYSSLASPVDYTDADYSSFKQLRKPDYFKPSDNSVLNGPFGGDPDYDTDDEREDVDLLDNSPSFEEDSFVDPDGQFGQVAAFDDGLGDEEVVEEDFDPITGTDSTYVKSQFSDGTQVEEEIDENVVDGIPTKTEILKGSDLQDLQLIYGPPMDEFPDPDSGLIVQTFVDSDTYDFYKQYIHRDRMTGQDKIIKVEKVTIGDESNDIDQTDDVLSDPLPDYSSVAQDDSYYRDY